MATDITLGRNSEVRKMNKSFMRTDIRVNEETNIYNDKEYFTYADFRSNLQLLRRRKNVSCQTASELCGLHPDAIRRYEKGEAEPNLNSLIKIADFFGVTIDYLIGRDRRNPT